MSKTLTTLTTLTTPTAPAQKRETIPTPHHGIRIAYTRSQDLIEHSPGERRYKWEMITRKALEVERLSSCLGWLPYKSLYRVVDAENIQGYYLVEEG